jgi:hypothetical protein
VFEREGCCSGKDSERKSKLQKKTIGAGAYLIRLARTYLGEASSTAADKPASKQKAAEAISTAFSKSGRFQS